MQTTSAPRACIAVRDEHCRSTIVQTLRTRGWSIDEQPTGIHLLDAIAGAILGDRPEQRPELIVVDARTPGCSGMSIARGLRDLGLQIPTVLVRSPEDRFEADETTVFVDPVKAPQVVAQIAESA